MKSPPARRQQIHWLPIVTLALLAAGMGCGDDTTTAPPTGDSPQLVHTAGSGLSPQSGGSSGSGSGEDVRKSVLISALKGGSFNAGRHRLTFPPGALLRDTQITIVDVTNRVGFVECELYPEGIVFLKPVTLETQFSDITDPAGYSMYWLADDSPVNVWMNVGGKLTSDGKGIVVTLHHFSDYAPGKTGW
jgi:hypothetical protein